MRRLRRRVSRRCQRGIKTPARRRAAGAIFGFALTGFAPGVKKGKSPGERRAFASFGANARGRFASNDSAGAERFVEFARRIRAGVRIAGPFLSDRASVPELPSAIRRTIRRRHLPLGNALRLLCTVKTQARARRLLAAPAPRLFQQSTLVMRTRLRELAATIDLVQKSLSIAPMLIYQHLRCRAQAAQADNTSARISLRIDRSRTHYKLPLEPADRTRASGPGRSGEKASQ